MWKKQNRPKEIIGGNVLICFNEITESQTKGRNLLIIKRYGIKQRSK